MGYWEVSSKVKKIAGGGEGGNRFAHHEPRSQWIPCKQSLQHPLRWCSECWSKCWDVRKPWLWCGGQDTPPPPQKIQKSSKKGSQGNWVGFNSICSKEKVNNALTHWHDVLDIVLSAGTSGPHGWGVASKIIPPKIGKSSGGEQVCPPWTQVSMDFWQTKCAASIEKVFWMLYQVMRCPQAMVEVLGGRLFAQKHKIAQQRGDVKTLGQWVSAR